MTKLIALLTARDEAPFLPHYLASVGAVVDELVVLDDRSVDGTTELLEQAGAVRLDGAALSDTTFAGRRAILLDEGRRRGGTHFVCLDADEVFLGDPHDVHASIISLRPGHVLGLQQINFWRGIERYRADWAYRRPLGCAFADDGRVHYDAAVIHEDRVPEPDWTTRVPVAEDVAAVGHLQFVAWRRSQAKQAWYRCLERIEGARPTAINARYWATTDRRGIRMRPVPATWAAQVRSTADLSDAPPSWHRAAVLAWFAEHGPPYFEPLEIWDDDVLRAAFVESEGRSPVPQRSWMVNLAVRRAVASDVSRAALRRVSKARRLRRRE